MCLYEYEHNFVYNLGLDMQLIDKYIQFSFVFELLIGYN